MSSDNLSERREGLLLPSANPKFCQGVGRWILQDQAVSDFVYQRLPLGGEGVALDVVEQASMPHPCDWTLGVQPGCPKASVDPQIKLFGQTIGVVSSRADAGADAGVLKPTSASPPRGTAPLSKQDGGDSVILRDENEGGVVENLRTARSSSRDEFLQPLKSSELVSGSRSLNTGVSLGPSDSEGAHSDELKDQGEVDHSQSVGDDKHLQKPDKVVSCPRCDSLDTKFCYYNNYNINQPRHFCKNCQRYWTAGGTLRNVPVGAGRRKNKHGGMQRDCPEASVNCSIQSDSGDSASQLLSCALGSPTSQKAGSSLKHAQPKRLAGQGSPMRSSGFGQDNGISISPPYSLHQNSRLPFQSFSLSQGFMPSEASTVGSSDSASISLGQRLARCPSGNGFDKDCSRSSLNGQTQDTHSLLSKQSAYNSSALQLEATSGMYRFVLPSSSSGWAGNGASVGFHSGEWPHGYHLELGGKHPISHSSQGVSYSTPDVRASLNAIQTLPPTSSWSPTLVQSGATQWGADVGHVHNPPQMAASVWPRSQSMVPSASSVGQAPVAAPTTLGKRGLLEEGSCEWPSKCLRTDDSKNLNTWAMPGKNSTEVMNGGNALSLFRPKLELAVACETKDSFMTRHLTTVAAARSGPFQVTI